MKKCLMIIGHKVFHVQSMFLYKERLAKDLMKRMCAWNPVARITASEALNHPWFQQ